MNILYVVPAMYPYGWAYAARARTLAKMMNDAGHEVTVMSDYLSDSVEWESNNFAKDGTIKIITTSCLKASNRRLKDKLAVSARLKKRLIEYLDNNDVDCIMCDQTSNKYLTIKKVIKKRGIPLILEVCEWYSYKNWKFGVLDPRFWQFLYCWKREFPKEKNVICISRLLESHFKKENINQIRIPAILDAKSKITKNCDVLHEPISLVFVGGITGGKDELSTLIEDICENDLPFSVDVYGPSEDAVFDTLHLDQKLKTVFREKIHIHGFVDQQIIETKIVNCDYGIIIRPHRRSSDAGFPTKLGEYFSAGLPVIANDTSDISLYLKDGKNGFVINSNKKEDILKVLYNVINTKNDYSSMSKLARQTAVNYLDFAHYVDAFKSFISTIDRNN